MLVTNRIDYHFACIRSDTDIMQGIFKDVYAASPGAAAFEAHVSLGTARLQRGVPAAGHPQSSRDQWGMPDYCGDLHHHVHPASPRRRTPTRPTTFFPWWSTA